MDVQFVKISAPDLRAPSPAAATGSPARYNQHDHFNTTKFIAMHALILPPTENPNRAAIRPLAPARKIQSGLPAPGTGVDRILREN
jgi:hypothetical protein